VASVRSRSGARRWSPIAITALALLAACTSGGSVVRPLPSGSGQPTPPSATRPNIVFVLTDDLSWNLIKYMPHVRALQRRGMTFSNYTVTDSLCCPSRASIFSGRFPHDTHIVSNTAPYGGFTRFHRFGEESNTFATSLYRAGYRTALMGKYLNGYKPADPPESSTSQGAWVPPGWTTWDGVGYGYPEYRYALADGHTVIHYGGKPRDYLTTVLQQRADAFVRGADRSRPFALEVATFAPHFPYTPAPADRGRFAGIAIPRTPSFNTLPRPAPPWLRGRRKLGADDRRDIQRWWQLRVEAVQSVDRLVGSLERSVRAVGQAKDTVFVFNSDNGYHLGEHRLLSGKQTAFDTDIRVPLIIAGPGIAAGSVNPAMVQNIDLRPTFDELGGAATPADVDGRSIVALLHGRPTPWRNYALIEHHREVHTRGDPDAQDKANGPVPPSYDAIRSATSVYIRYLASGAREYYDLAKDPDELHNLGPSLSRKKAAALDRVMNRLIHCHGRASCWHAGRAPVVR
jgi:N-acetylglucosamine-6-sulfatase